MTFIPNWATEQKVDQVLKRTCIDAKSKLAEVVRPAIRVQLGRGSIDNAVRFIATNAYIQNCRKDHEYD